MRQNTHIALGIYTHGGHGLALATIAGYDERMGFDRACLTAETLRRHIDELAGLEPVFGRIVREFGPAPLWARRPGFSALLRIILEQQVSLASARAAFQRLRASLPRLTSRNFLELDDGALRAVGFSRQKAAYGRNLAEAILSGSLHLSRLQTLDDDAARGELTRVKGIGMWTADVYLLMALRRPDIWPCGDLALAAAARSAFGLRSLPSPAQLESMGRPWRPRRAVAARILWHYYLSRGATGGRGGGP